MKYLNIDYINNLGKNEKLPYYTESFNHSESNEIIMLSNSRVLDGLGSVHYSRPFNKCDEVYLVKGRIILVSEGQVGVLFELEISCNDFDLPNMRISYTKEFTVYDKPVTIKYDYDP